MRTRVVLQVAKTTFQEFWRSKEAVFWTYGFPVLMAVVLGFAFQPQPPAPVPIAVLQSAAAALQPALQGDPRLQLEVLDAEAADAALARGRVALLLSGTPQAPVLRADPARPEAELARLLVLRALHPPGNDDPQPVIEAEQRPGSRYIDFLIPGLIGINLLGAGMWGVGFNLVQLRTQNLLRRLLVSPMRKSEFFAGFLLGRLILVTPESLAIVLFGWLAFDVPMRGSLAAMLLLILAGALAFTALGVLVAARPLTIEGASGLMNLVMLPMWLLGGSFFSNERFDGVLGAVAHSLPLSWVNEALRDVMLEPGGIAVALSPVLLLGGFALVCFGLALRWFRWV